MKILFVCGAPRVFGRETVTLSLMQGLRDRGHEISCITSIWSDGRFEKRVAGLAVPFVSLPLGFISKKLSVSAMLMTVHQALKLPTLWLGYKRTRDSLKPDIVIHSGLHHVFLLAPFLRKSRDMFHVHSAVAQTSFYRSMFKVFSQRIAAFVGVSRFTADTITDLGVPAAKVHVVLNGIAADNGRVLSTHGNGLKQKREQRPGGPIRIGIVGQVEEWKGHEDLIDALHILENRSQPFTCRIFGEGSKEFAGRLKSRIAGYGLTSKIEWMGFTDNRETIYSGLDLCVVPSRGLESFGMVAAEALTYGVPVIASRMGGLPEVIVDDKCGYLVDPRSPEQIADKILELSRSRVRQPRIGPMVSPQVLETLSANRMVNEMESLLLSLTNGNGHPFGVS